ncbi:hypothetical protein MJO29_015125 [Puccinia striiformis f. sp. tritici]|nr:hypothetical protein MJO29_015125 [Puccinia striiformis f. sp. tritici]
MVQRKSSTALVETTKRCCESDQKSATNLKQNPHPSSNSSSSSSPASNQASFHQSKERVLWYDHNPLTSAEIELVNNLYNRS